MESSLCVQTTDSRYVHQALILVSCVIAHGIVDLEKSILVTAAGLGRQMSHNPGTIYEDAQV